MAGSASKENLALTKSIQPIATLRMSFSLGVSKIYGVRKRISQIYPTEEGENIRSTSARKVSKGE